MIVISVVGVWNIAQTNQRGNLRLKIATSSAMIVIKRWLFKTEKVFWVRVWSRRRHYNGDDYFGSEALLYLLCRLYLTRMVPSSPELSRVLPSHWPDLLSYCCPVGAIVGPDHHDEDHELDHHDDKTFCVKGNNGAIARTTGRAFIHSASLPQGIRWRQWGREGELLIMN